MATHRFVDTPPHRRSRRRLAITAALLAPLLAGCGAGFQAQTNQIFQPGPGISVRDGGVYAINALIVTDGKGNGTLVGALIDQAPRTDKLMSVSVTNASGTALKTTTKTPRTVLPPQRAIQLGYTGSVRVTGKLVAGSFCSLTLTFRNAAPINVQIPVVSKTLEYSKIPVGSASTS